MSAAGTPYPASEKYTPNSSIESCNNNILIGTIHLTQDKKTEPVLSGADSTIKV